MQGLTRRCKAPEDLVRLYKALLLEACEVVAASEVVVVVVVVVVAVVVVVMVVVVAETIRNSFLRSLKGFWRFLNSPRRL